MRTEKGGFGRAEAGDDSGMVGAGEGDGFGGGNLEVPRGRPVGEDGKFVEGMGSVDAGGGAAERFGEEDDRRKVERVQWRWRR